MNLIATALLPQRPASAYPSTWRVASIGGDSIPKMGSAPKQGADSSILAAVAWAQKED